MEESEGVRKNLNEKLEALKQVDDELPIILIVHSLENMNVEYMSPRGLKILGLTLAQVKKLGPEYFQLYFNPEDVDDYLPKILNLLRADEEGERDKIVSYFQQVRPSKHDDWKWYLSTVKVFMRDAAGKPSHLITSAAPIDLLHHVTAKVGRLLEENNFIRRNQKLFASLTKRQREITRLMALGLSAGEIAKKLSITEETASTHRRNIRTKLGAQSNYDITQFAQAFDLI